MMVPGLSSPSGLMVGSGPRRGAHSAPAAPLAAPSAGPSIAERLRVLEELRASWERPRVTEADRLIAQGITDPMQTDGITTDRAP